MDDAVVSTSSWSDSDVQNLLKQIQEDLAAIEPEQDRYYISISISYDYIRETHVAFMLLAERK